jgi:hypothetical protein
MKRRRCHDAMLAWCVLPAAGSTQEVVARLAAADAVPASWRWPHTSLLRPGGNLLSNDGEAQRTACSVRAPWPVGEQRSARGRAAWPAGHRAAQHTGENRRRARGSMVKKLGLDRF